jgi:GNAT superfamily N-acetyltransferase
VRDRRSQRRNKAIARYDRRCHLDQGLSMLRRATLADIPRIIEIRGAVRENRLSDPSRVTAADVRWHIAHSPIHVWDDSGVIKGFSAGDPRDGSIFALFVDPTFEGQGIGQALILAASRSLAAAGHRIAKLSTDPGTRAERFYLRNGWLAKGIDTRGEMIFEKEIRCEG